MRGPWELHIWEGKSLGIRTLYVSLIKDLDRLNERGW
jgi:hypothetical protein